MYCVSFKSKSVNIFSFILVASLYSRKLNGIFFSTSWYTLQNDDIDLHPEKMFATFERFIVLVEKQSIN